MTCIGNIDSNQHKILEFQSYGPSFAIEIRTANSIGDIDWEHFGEHSSACISLFDVAGIPILDIPRWNKFLNRELLNFGLIRFKFLQAQNVRILLVEKFLKCTLGENCIDAINIPRPYRDLVFHEAALASVFVHLIY